MQFMDPYGQVFAYVGARATGNTGGTILVAGPTWNGIVPNGMHEIKTPTNIAWISNRIFVNGTSDLPNVHAIQNQIILFLSIVYDIRILATAITRPMLITGIIAFSNQLTSATTPTIAAKTYTTITAGLSCFDCCLTCVF